MKRMKIYTRRGDDGATNLADGRRLPKTDSVFEVLGQLDELSARLGRARVSLPSGKVWKIDDRLLRRAQAGCLAAGALAAGAPDEVLTAITTAAAPADITALEERIDFRTDALPPLKSFILPGGSLLAADLHLARVAARALERQWLTLPQALSSDGSVWPVWRQYWNRLSDYLFALARAAAADGGESDETWGAA